MNKQPRIPDPDTSKRLLANLRRTRLELHEVNLQLEEISAQFEQELREQKFKRVRQKLSVLDAKESSKESSVGGDRNL
ncbi:hypothetical protein [Gloeocapsa sp. PCC 73106]|uniref:hypothetical protein n=1 Tax=Gloeocapsa sp. PCC 73106 TaxID=102232 RepID=UPI0002AC12D7|nr:hypothetical protein [Gloeocapsa sp. PCC 73106]ELR98179.1 hypothetical protein GLO73106DRAFT_00020060 [Gloeocapsa sp. PCC 73106]